ncbi:MAG: RNA-guided pseudouridylation complex pseudouridine synthase subunit Cbf5 [Candidatus Methanoplasma sp.]|nr:RNA-guided pseudouridylation complex pseudouridine synthase subunit Cbf5 [Candidatus Methanoplasma sp.]
MLVKDPDTLPDKWGKRPSDRSVGELLNAGVIALDKPSGPTSHQATAWARNALHVENISHGGTLDPYVSGVLPICLGKAVRLTDIVLSSDKEYVCLMRLHKDVEKERIIKVMEKFVGKIYQTPPVRSAVKRQLRIRTVERLEIIEIKGREILFRVSCDAGTYIRTLCTDAGEALGCGANMVELRRTRSGIMKEDNAATLQDMTDAYIFWQQMGKEKWLRSMLMPMEVLVEPLPKVIVKPTAVDAVCHGADLNIQGIHMLDDDIRKNALVAMMTARGELIAIGKMMMSTPKIMSAEQGKAVDVERVFMERGHYPKMWRFSTDIEEIGERTGPDENTY